SPSPSRTPFASLSPAPTPVPPLSPTPSGSALPSGSPTPSPSASSSAAGLFHIGEPAPALVVAKIGGGDLDLTSLRGKPVWLNFMATWCPSCRDELPLMNGYSARYGGDGLVVVAVDVKEAADLVGPYMTSLNVNF